MKVDPNAAGPSESAQELRALFDRAAVGIALLDRQGRFLQSNPRMLQLAARSADELARISWAEITHPDDWTRNKVLFLELAGGERAEFQIEQRVVRPDASWVWVSLCASSLRAGSGHADRLIAVARDITEQKLTEDAMRRSELRFRRLIDKLPAGAYTCDPEGLITYYNDRAVRLWGRAPKLHDAEDRFCGSFKLFSNDGIPLAHERCWMARALREGREYDGEEILIERPDGSRVAALAHASPIRDDTGRLIGSMNVLVDITDRKRAEAMLLGSELRFTQFMQHLHGLAWIKNFDGRYLFFNDAAEHALGIAPAEFTGRTDEEIFPPRAAAQFRENDRKVLATGTACETIEMLEHADGLHHWMVSKFPIPGPDGSSTRVGGIAIDVTESVRSKEALLEADRRKDEFLATLAHELRNPLAPIRSSLRILRESSGVSLELLEMLERQVGQMVRLVDDLMEISRIARGRVELRRERVELASVLRTALETCAPTIEGGHHALDVSLPRDPLVLEADPLRLGQVFVNLLDNAARYTPDGGRIWVSASRRGDEAVVSVRDDGVGIPADALRRIFEPFTHIDRAMGRAHGGLGIGLALVEQLVRMHGGGVEVRSGGSGKGSEFIVMLPLARRSAQSPRAAGERAAGTAAAESPTPGSVLLVDDNLDAAESLAMLLRSRGFDVQIAHDGPSALEAARVRRPAAVLLDISMPGMDGFEVARRLRELPGADEMLLIALTGWGQPEVRSSCQDAGIDHHLVKPVELESLEALLALPRRRPPNHP